MVYRILKTAYKAGLIREEELWIEALASRNNVVHAYNQAVALDIVKAVREKYYRMFEKLREEVEENWR